MGKQMTETKVALAVLEMLEDRSKECVEHMMDVNTVEGKPCKVLLEVVFTPNAERDDFEIAVTSKASLSPRLAAKSRLYAGKNRKGEVEFAERDRFAGIESAMAEA